jgi:AcrR family transcriptional regulator
VSPVAAEVDGRRARRDRNRDAVVDALLDLYRSGDLNPSVTCVARRSGVSPRSVFRYFSDLDTMGRIAIERHSRAVKHLFLLPRIGEGSRPERINHLVEHRLRVYAEVAPITRAARLRAPFEPSIAATLAERRATVRRQIDEHFAAELARVPDSERYAVASAADACTSFTTMELLRVDGGMVPERCAQVMRTALDRLLPG